ncbi:hypothetical protein DXG01_001070 [Tephrocybe rancida]|nr:hypothetical protein DXG01_001070 [Tephrocybe rancida]
MSHFQFPLPDLYFPPSPSDSGSSSPEPMHIVCNPPLVAPKPLPYHSPTFLQFELPDLDQDLSHPPYTRRSSKRKRTSDGVEQPTSEQPAQKKRTGLHQSPAPHSHRPERTLKKRTRLHAHT